MTKNLEIFLFSGELNKADWDWPLSLPLPVPVPAAVLPPHAAQQLQQGSRC
jgi:hypothetical protein